MREKTKRRIGKVIDVVVTTGCVLLGSTIVIKLLEWIIGIEYDKKVVYAVDAILLIVLYIDMFSYYRHKRKSK